MFLKTNMPVNKAREIILRIYNKTELLLTMPEIGQKEPEFEELKYSYRRIIESHYKIIYRIESTSVYIERVFDSRLNPNKLFIK